MHFLCDLQIQYNYVESVTWASLCWVSTLVAPSSASVWRWAIFSVKWPSWASSDSASATVHACTCSMSTCTWMHVYMQHEYMYTCMYVHAAWAHACMYMHEHMYGLIFWEVIIRVCNAHTFYQNKFMCTKYQGQIILNCTYIEWARRTGELTQYDHHPPAVDPYKYKVLYKRAVSCKKQNETPKSWDTTFNIFLKKQVQRTLDRERWHSAPRSCRLFFSSYKPT